jgi:hypothetical protein
VHRKVTSVEWARACERPRAIPRTRHARGTKAKGLAYERALYRAMCGSGFTFQHGQWFAFHADGKLGFCQPDFVYPSSAIIVIECKLTNIEQATEQLLDLYFPVLRAAYDRPVRGIIAVRSVHRCPDLAHITTSLREAIDVAETKVPVLHWIGKGAL